ncbi:hypothetical protein GLA29479_3548 [Lysobacter antibioticus]|uniref:Uncharacterized protein n=1 Tax=Lysobacter antibioticus TaxID=84531 RepID=A0A0S2E123_LYSAN|nr:hypothetical protein GLA29479_3548 [Lysobacter antibioticus]ALN82074.1 hypothetical protein LA76x_3958 [Lysobacter antibioticus]
MLAAVIVAIYWTDRANRIVENHVGTSGPVEWRPSAARSLSQAPEPMSRDARRLMKLSCVAATAVYCVRRPGSKRTHR